MPAFRLLESAFLKEALPGLVAGFSTDHPPVSDSDLNRSFLSALQNFTLQNTTLHNSRRTGSLPGVLLAQYHSAEILHWPGLNKPEREGFYASEEGHSALAYDGAATHVEDPAWLMVKTADCVPLLLIDPDTRHYAALHAGWRGTAQGILPRLLSSWKKQGSSLSGVRMELGPHIRACCYEVGQDCLDQFSHEALKHGAVPVNGGHHLNLGAVLSQQAIDLGVAAANIQVSDQCTRCTMDESGVHPFASYRRTLHQLKGQDSKGKTGRNVAFFGIVQSA